MQLLADIELSLAKLDKSYTEARHDFDNHMHSVNCHDDSVPRPQTGVVPEYYDCFFYKRVKDLFEIGVKMESLKREWTSRIPTTLYPSGARGSRPPTTIDF